MAASIAIAGCASVDRPVLPEWQARDYSGVEAQPPVLGGSYTLEGDRLTLLPGMTTLAECGTDSLYDLYLSTLGRVESLSVEEGRLVLHLRENAGSMVLRNASPAGEGGGGDTGADIIGRIWAWKETLTPVGATRSGDPEKYTVELLSDVAKNAAALNEICLQITHIEGEADDTYDRGLELLYQKVKGGDALDFIRGSEIYKHLEHSVDSLDDIADEIQGIVIEHV